MSIAYVKKEDIGLQFENGFAQAEMLPGCYPNVKTYRCALQAGCSVKPKTYSRSHQMLCLTDGKGYITTPKRAYNVDEVSFFFANFEEEFTITAVTDMSWTTFVVDISEKEWPEFYRSHLVLPYFRPLSTANEYWQDCKTAGMRGWHIVVGHQMYPIIMGVCQTDLGGTIEKGHPGVAQWNVLYGDSEIVLTIADESVHLKGGDFSYVPAGPDHSLTTKPGEQMSYIWVEHYTHTDD